MVKKKKISFTKLIDNWDEKNGLTFMREEENELNGYNGIGDFNLVDHKKGSEIILTY